MRISGCSHEDQYSSILDIVKEDPYFRKMIESYENMKPEEKLEQSSGISTLHLLKNEKPGDLSLEHLRQIKPILAGDVFKEFRDQVMAIDKNPLFKYLYLDEYFIEDLLTIADVREIVDPYRPTVGPVIYYIYDGLVNVFDSKTN